jgi:NADH dehydrogenase (ubiquinone) Fe-S protein 5
MVWPEVCAIDGKECATAGKRRKSWARKTGSIGRASKHAYWQHRLSLPGPSRCFPFWQDVLACYVVNTSTEDDSGKKKCGPVLEDYYECLHHRKEVCIWTLGKPHNAQQNTFDSYLLSPLQAAKVTALQAAYRRKEAETPRDNAPSADQIRTLGLLNRTDEEVNIFPAKFLPKIEHMNGSRKPESS